MLGLEGFGTGPAKICQKEQSGMAGLPIQFVSSCGVQRGRAKTGVVAV